MSKKLDPGYFSSRNLKKLGFKHIGEDVFIAKDAIIIGFENISIGNNVKIDSNVTFAASSGSLSVGSNVHIGGGSHLSCSGSIQIEDFVTISQGVKIYSASDDYSGDYMTNPLVPKEFTNVNYGLVTLGEHVIVGSGSVLLPGTTLFEGTAVGALTLVNKSVGPWGIYSGVPAKLVKARSKEILNKQKLFEQNF